MVRRCVVGGCNNTTKDGVSLHKFPRDQKLRNQWNKFVAVKRADWHDATKHSEICSAHFESNKFVGVLMKETGHRNRVDLAADAVPTIQPAMSVPVTPVRRGKRPATQSPAAGSATGSGPSPKTPSTFRKTPNRTIQKLHANRVSILLVLSDQFSILFVLSRP